MEITVGDLKRKLSAFGDEMTVSFSGLDFYRLKPRGPDVVQIEFNQVVYKDEQGLVHVENIE